MVSTAHYSLKDSFHPWSTCYYRAGPVGRTSKDTGGGKEPPIPPSSSRVNPVTSSWWPPTAQAGMYNSVTGTTSTYSYMHRLSLEGELEDDAVGECVGGRQMFTVHSFYCFDFLSGLCIIYSKIHVFIFKNCLKRQSSLYAGCIQKSPPFTSKAWCHWQI